MHNSGNDTTWVNGSLSYLVVPMRGGDIVVVYVVCKNGTLTGFVIVLLEFQYYTKNLYLHGAIPGGVAGGLGTVILVYCKTVAVLTGGTPF